MFSMAFKAYDRMARGCEMPFFGNCNDPDELDDGGLVYEGAATSTRRREGNDYVDLRVGRNSTQAPWKSESPERGGDEDPHTSPAASSPRAQPQSSLTQGPIGDDPATASARRKLAKAEIIFTGDAAADAALARRLTEAMKAEAVEQMFLADRGQRGYNEHKLEDPEMSMHCVVRKKFREKKFDAVSLRSSILGLGPEEIMDLWTTTEFKKYKKIYTDAVGVKLVTEWPELGAKILYVRQGKYGKGLISQRDYVQLSVVWVDEAGVLWNVARDVQHPSVLPNKDYIRGRILLSALKVEGSASYTVHGSVVHFLNVIDLSGYLQPVAYESTLPTEYRKLFKQLKALGEDRQGLR